MGSLSENKITFHGIYGVWYQPGFWTKAWLKLTATGLVVVAFLLVVWLLVRRRKNVPRYATSCPVFKRRMVY